MKEERAPIHIEEGGYSRQKESLVRDFWRIQTRFAEMYVVRREPWLNNLGILITDDLPDRKKSKWSCWRYLS